MPPRAPREQNSSSSVTTAEIDPRAQELLTDIGRVLHANTNLLIMTEHSLNGVVELLGDNAKTATLPDPDDADEQLYALALRLAAAMEHFFQTTDPERRAEALPAAEWELMNEQPARLREIRDAIPIPEMRAPTLRVTAHEIAARYHNIAPGQLAREPVRHVLTEAEALERAAVRLDVLKTLNAIIQMEYTLRSLREYISSGVRQDTPPKRVLVRELVERAIRQLSEYARNSRVEIRWREHDFEDAVLGDERELVRAFSNVLHNAIKYSWRRDRAQAPWVRIVTRAENSHVLVEFENWGVPIERDEIETGQIFHFGYRGRRATDRGRLGTGIGLTDAKRVAEAHGGVLRVDSHPSLGGMRPDDPDYYEHPFLTTVTFELPLTD